MIRTYEKTTHLLGKGVRDVETRHVLLLNMQPTGEFLLLAFQLLVLALQIAKLARITALLHSFHPISGREPTASPAMD